MITWLCSRTILSLLEEEKEELEDDDDDEKLDELKDELDEENEEELEEGCPTKYFGIFHPCFLKNQQRCIGFQFLNQL